MRYPSLLRRGLVLFGFLALAALVPDRPAPRVAAAQGDEAKQQPRVVVGKFLSPTASIIYRDHSSAKWLALKQGSDVYSGDLLVGKPVALIDSKNGAVQLTLDGDLDWISPFPILEPGVILNQNDKVDLDFTLDRGRVEITNKKAKGAARVMVHFRDAHWLITLQEPGTKVGMEIYGRWARGVFFNKDDNPQPAPIGALALIVIKGEIELDHFKQKNAMMAPPGPALFEWDSVTRVDPGPTRLDKLPAWADPDTKLSKEGKMWAALIEMMRQRQAATSVDEAIEEALKSADPRYRHIGVIALGATDNLPRLIDCLSDPRHADLRDDAITILRHWLGRRAGQDLKLYNALIASKKYTPVEIGLIMTGLHSFGPNELSRPETYEALIAYLGHDKIAIRELAEFHLYRLVPAGKDIKYNPAGTKAEIEKTIKEWKELIPEGQLPPKPKAEPKKDKFPKDD